MTVSRVLRVLAKLGAAVVGLVLLGYLFVNVGALVAASAHRDELAGQITQRLAETVPAARERQQQVSATASRRPDRTWLVQECSFETRDAGWMVQSYREVCTLRSVAAWQVEDLRAARALVDGVPGLEGLRQVESLGCTAVAHGPTGTASYVAGGWDREVVMDRPWCLVGVEPRDSQPSRAVTGSPELFDPGVDWLVLDHEVELVEEDLGCVHWSVLFCDNPFGDELAWGDAPA
ncbi:hypothetical protein [Nocardioides coralli]|uniref:hypothetical protein n=1 Tax=Nocardioides coralli TaxID=2872154 RepID=UPI001CA43943|nr:hypothetical protein [Nocardioides coralli]QZY28893.1 hypothetical protein K6T13_15815 [Nocardioides coralli]